MELTKYNTALDLSKLTEQQSNELFDFIRKVDFIWSSWRENEITKFFKEINKGFFGISGNMYSHVLILNETVVDFDTFKSIHFPEPSSRRQEDDRPSYEDLADMLKRCVWLINMLDAPSPLVEDYGNTLMNAESILERIK